MTRVMTEVIMQGIDVGVLTRVVMRGYGKGVLTWGYDAGIDTGYDKGL
jgi:hypothetical protein